MSDVHKFRSKQQLLNSMPIPVVASSWTPVLALHASRAPGTVKPEQGLSFCLAALEMMAVASRSPPRT